MLFAIQIPVNMEEIAVIMEQDTTATVIMVTLGNTAKVSSKAQMNNVTTTIITPKCITLT